MRTFLTVLLSCLLLSNINGQVQVINLSLTDSSLNYFYIGADNLLKVNWKGIDPLTATISVLDGAGRITKTDDTHFFVQVITVTDSCRLEIRQKGGKLLFGRYYKCRVINPVIARPGNLSDSVVTVKEVLINPYITALSPGCFYDLRYQIVSFSTDIIHDGETAFIAAYGNLFNPEQLKLIKTLVHGDQIYFHDIRINYADSRTSQLPPFRIYIK
ncbi:MAG: GldM family protein [Chitinophagaceae bacterium]